MITITETDILLPVVLQESKLGNLITKHKYHVYGLRQENNPVVQFEYNDDYVDQQFHDLLKSLTEFLELNGIQVETSDSYTDHEIAIGLRIDLRKTLNRNKKPLMAASVLSTIVYCLEDRLDIDKLKNYKLSSIPSFPRKDSDA